MARKYIRRHSLAFRIGLVIFAISTISAFSADLMLVMLANVSLSALFGMLIVALTMAFISAIIGYVVARRMLRPLTRLADSAARLAVGDLTTPIPAQSDEEISALARSLENARHELEGMTR